MSKDLPDLIQQLDQLNVKLTVKGDKLSISAPKGALTPQLTEQLKQHKAALIDHVVSQQSQITPLVVQDNQAEPVLSFGQERLWVLTQWNGDHAAFHIGSILIFDETLVVEALSRAIQDLVVAHACLRALFTSSDGAPQQMILPISDFSQHRKVLEVETDVVSLDQARAKARERAALPFDLTREIPLRARLYPLEEGGYALEFLLHHIASDGWSGALIIQTLREYYTAHSRGEQPEIIQKSPVSYADYAYWLRKRAQTGEFKAQIDWWCRQLQGAPNLDLPSDRLRPASQQYDGAVLQQRWDASMRQRIERASAAGAVTSFITLLSAFAVLIHRYTGSEAFVIGTPVSGRVRSELETVVGVFINMLALRIDCSGQPSFAQLRQRICTTVYDALEHQEAPFEQVVEALQIQRDASRSPLFQVMFNLERTDAQADGSDWQILRSSESIRRNASLYDLCVNVNMFSDRIDVCWEYATALFDQDSIAAMAQHFDATLNFCLAATDAPIHTLDLMTQAERDRHDQQWNATRQQWQGWPETVDAHIEQIAQAHANAIAVTDSHNITYQALLDRVYKLSARLQASGVRLGDRVGIHLMRGANLVVALLAVLRSGAAYVPLDPGFPQERLTYMVDDAALEVIISESGLLDTFSTVRVLDVNTDASDELPFEPVQVSGSDLAYVIYTSGSTGQPKGVEIPHCALVNFLASMAERPGCGREDVLLAVTTFSFDIAALELLLPLSCGAQVVIADSATAYDGAGLLRLIDQHHVTMMQATPATWQLMLQAGWEQPLPIKVLCGGEALPLQLAQALLERAEQLWNMYGPTETTIWSTCEQVLDAKNISIGRPIANTKIAIVDQAGQRLPEGLRGELCISGLGLARGYRNRPELNEKSFFYDERGLRWYRTGDSARWLRDGRIQVLGRLDNQVKLRGYRIELGEIESALEQHPAIRRAVVVVREDEPGNQRLVCYCIARDREIAHDDIRLWLLRTVPDYMVPVATVWLAAFPMTPNRKVDRKALPKPEPIERVVSAQDVPSTKMERLLASVFQEVLQIEQVGLSDNFFDLGGHSLLSLKVVSRVQELAGVRLHPGELIQQTLGQLAATHS